jgi:hypothetical protein
LFELVVGIGVAMLLFLGVIAFTMFCSRSFAALYNYVELDDVNRVAIDQITRDVRQANRVAYFAPDGKSLTLQDGDAAGTAITYVYNANSRTLTRTRGVETTVVLRECDSLAFWIGQRNTDVGGYDVFPVATTLETAKVVNVRWVCSRSLFGHKANTESVQTARIVIRKQSV